MINWGKYPFVRLIGPFALGIWCCLRFAVPLPVSSLLVVMLVLVVFSSAVSKWLGSFRYNWVFGVLLCCFLFCAGYALTEAREPDREQGYFRNDTAMTGYYVARVWDVPSEREKTVRAVLELCCHYEDTLPLRAVSGRVMGYFGKGDSALALRYGDMIAFPAPIAEVEGLANPGEFDYRGYLWRKGITGQVYLRNGRWLDLSENRARIVYAFSYRFRDRLLEALRHCGIRDDEFSVAAAILLGYDDNLPPQIRENYVAAGAMHILCVSGLHVGVIYLIASFMLGFLKRKRWQVLTKHVLLLLLIWFYALIAGLSPSILRASSMISFVIIGEMIRRKGFVLNSIAASAFILLCINPNNILEIGFLLSYMAVVGIIVLQKPIYHLLYVPNRPMDKVWQITTVALAAQLATCPITIYYFHQFSSYFWLSNLLMTPISFFVILGGMMLLMVSWIPYVNVIMGYAVWGMLYGMNAIIAWIEKLPYSIIKGLYMSPLEYACAQGLLLLLLLYVTLRHKRYVVEMLLVLLVFTVSFTIRHFENNRQKAFAVYSLRSHTAVDFIQGSRHVVMADSALFSDDGAIDYSLKTNWLKRGLSVRPQMFALSDDFQCDFVHKKNNLVSYGGKLLALWDDANKVDDTLSFRIPVDFLLVKGRSCPDMTSVVNCYEVSVLLIDRSVPVYLAEKWKRQAEEYAVPVVSLYDGAFVVELH